MLATDQPRALQLAKHYKLENEIKIVEMNPPDMASALSAGSLDAYYGGEPCPAMTLRSGDASLLTYAEGEPLRSKI